VTIAACYVTPEGVVLGADSTTSAMLAGGFHYFNYSQKVFEIGNPGEGTLGIVTWGLAGIDTHSFRTLLALLHDGFKGNRPKTVQEVASRWIDQIWKLYEPRTTRCKALNAKEAYDPLTVPADPAARTKQEEDEFTQLKRGLVLGFFLGGHVPATRTPQAFSISRSALGEAQPRIFRCLEFCRGTQHDQKVDVWV
jgi:hypothetical protein